MQDTQSSECIKHELLYEGSINISILKFLPTLLRHIAINLHINCNLFVTLIKTDDDDDDEMMIQRFVVKVSDDDNNDNIC